MARREDAAAKPELPSEDQVARYLRAHPDFLLRRPELAVRLAVPGREHGGGVADLQQYMIDRLRNELDQMRGCAEHLITTTRSNMTTQARTHDAALALLGADGMAGMVQVLGDVAALLEVETVALAFEAAGAVVPPLAAAGLQRLPAGSVDVLFEGERGIALRSSAPGEAEIFADAAGLVRSSALVRLAAGGRCPPGLLALGAREERFFHPGQAADLLSFLGRVAEIAVRRWVG
jgi:uncharacterized protein YigA (DUF484 family)